VFADLYDWMSKSFAWRWPAADGEITAVRFLSPDEGLIVEYKFSLSNDGPYTGESRWSPWFGHTDVMDIHKTLPIGSPVTVRYGPDDPSVNTLDRRLWTDL
jgi:uncharacterized protein DUF3592